MVYLLVTITLRFLRHLDLSELSKENRLPRPV